jgi:hypothetical protein
MTILEQAMELIDNEAVHKSHGSFNLFAELNMGKFIVEGEMDTFCLNDAFEFDPDDFLEDVAFLCIFATDKEQKDDFINYIYMSFQDYWSSCGITEAYFPTTIENTMINLTHL